MKRSTQLIADVRSRLEPYMYQVVRLSTWDKITLFASTVSNKQALGYQGVIEDNVDAVELGSNMTSYELRGLNFCTKCSPQLLTTLKALRKAANLWFSAPIELYLRDINDPEVTEILQSTAPRRVRFLSYSFIFEKMLSSENECFAHVTHLRIPHYFIRPHDKDHMGSTMSHFPSLQHLLIAATAGYPLESLSCSLGLAKFCLENKATLRGCGIITLPRWRAMHSNLINDPRIILLDWKNDSEEEWDQSYYSRLGSGDIGGG
jgi:hypothetical protein